MKQYIIKRLLWLIPVMFFVSAVSFMLMHLSPGDPAEIFFSKGGDVPNPAAVSAMREKLGLNEPILKQYTVWVGNLLHGDFGYSISSGRPVLSEILKYFPNTLRLTFLSMALTLLVSIPLGVLAAVKENKAADYLIRILSFVSSSMPGFFVALILIYIFSIKFRLLPVISAGNTDGIILPALTLAICLSANYVRQVRAAVIREMGEEYIRMERARGIRESSILFGSALKSSMPAILAIAGMNIGHLLGGTSIIEIVFTYPGIGRLAVQAITERDYPMVQGYMLLTATICTAINLITDVLHAYAAPLVKYGIEAGSRGKSEKA